MRIDGNVVYSSDASEQALEFYKIGNDPINSDAMSQPRTFDFSAKNARAISRRAGRLQGIHPKPGTQHGGATYLLDSLKDEIAQLQSLIASVKRGETFHARGIAARLRLLLLRDGQNPLLQTTAATKDLPLIAYTAANPQLKFPFSPQKMADLGLIHLIFNSISGVPVAS
jgi:hypothetical protein